MTIRTATLADLDAVTDLEAACFPPAETAARVQIQDRLSHYPDHFWLLFQGDELVSFVNGFVTAMPDLTDAMYADASLHDAYGAWQMIFSVATHPDWRGKGCAGALLRHAIGVARTQGRKGLVLTCKESKLGYYAQFGFVDEGITDQSTHGGVAWHQMRLTL